MSVELRILPEIEIRPRWGVVLAEVRAGPLSRSANGLLGNAPGILTFEGQAPLGDEDELQLAELYVLSLARPSSLSLYLSPLSESEDPSVHLERVAIDADPETRERYAVQWRKAGYSIALESWAPRSRAELEILGALACATAAAVRGVIVVEDQGWASVPQGIHPLERFRGARRKVPAWWERLRRYLLNVTRKSESTPTP